MTESENQYSYGIFSTAKNKKIIAELEEQGANLIKITTPQTVKAELKEAALESLLNPTRFDWIIFTDVLTVDYFLEAAEENGLDLFELDEVRICAFGEAVSDRLRFVQIHTDVLPNKIDDEEIITAIENYVSGEDHLDGQRILVIKPKNAKVSIIEKLVGVKAAVSVLEIYEIVEHNTGETAKIKALVTGGAIDEFIFTAPEDLIYLGKLLNVEKPDSRLFDRFSAVEQNIFKKLFELGITPVHFQK